MTADRIPKNVRLEKRRNNSRPMLLMIDNINEEIESLWTDVKGSTGFDKRHIGQWRSYLRTHRRQVVGIRRRRWWWSFRQLTMLPLNYINGCLSVCLFVCMSLCLCLTLSSHPIHCKNKWTLLIIMMQIMIETAFGADLQLFSARQRHPKYVQISCCCHWSRCGDASDISGNLWP